MLSWRLSSLNQLFSLLAGIVSQLQACVSWGVFITPEFLSAHVGSRIPYSKTTAVVIILSWVDTSSSDLLRCWYKMWAAITDCVHQSVACHSASLCGPVWTNDNSKTMTTKPWAPNRFLSFSDLVSTCPSIQLASYSIYFPQSYFLCLLFFPYIFSVFCDLKLCQFLRSWMKSGHKQSVDTEGNNKASIS